MKHLGTVTLETERLILRRAKIGDAESMYRNWAGDDKVTKYLTWQTYGSVREAEDYIKFLNEQYKTESNYDWFIELKEIKEPIGSIGVVRLREDTESAVIGYCIGSKWWHRGIMTEAFTEVIRFLFEEIGVRRIEAEHDTENPNSGKVMKKCGLIYEGTRRRGGKNNRGIIIDVACYAVLKEDYDKKM